MEVQPTQEEKCDTNIFIINIFVKTLDAHRIIIAFIPMQFSHFANHGSTLNYISTKYSNHSVFCKDSHSQAIGNLNVAASLQNTKI